MTIEIDGVEYVPIKQIENEVAATFGVDTLDIENLKERKARTEEQAQALQEQRKNKVNAIELTEHINKHFSNSLKRPEQFIELCINKGLTIEEDSEVLKMYKALPKQAKKSIVDKFLKR